MLLIEVRNVGFIEVASSAKVSLPLLTELALLGIEENLKNPVSMPINLPKKGRGQ